MLEGLVVHAGEVFEGLLEAFLDDHNERVFDRACVDDERSAAHFRSASRIACLHRRIVRWMSVSCSKRSKRCESVCEGPAVDEEEEVDSGSEEIFKFQCARDALALAR